MPFDLSSFNFSLLGWLLIGVAIVVLAVAVLRLFGHLLHILVRGCGFVLLGAVILYALHRFGVI